VDGEVLCSGEVLLAPGNHHLVLKRSMDRYRVRCQGGPPVHHMRPSVDVLFRSVAEAAGPKAVGALLTGMGRDGAEGLLALRRVGAATLAQDEATSVVFGMPKEAAALGAVEKGTPLGCVAQEIQRAIRRMEGTEKVLTGGGA
jgi:two-component system chemotaxis response regulator CheB